MKYCEEYAALLDLFVDGELTPPEMERVRDHLAECPGCRAYADDALAIRAGFPEAEDTIVPDGFAEGVMERIRKASPGEKPVAELKRRGFRRWMRTAAALAACCALVVLARTGPAGGGQAAVTSAGIDGASTYDYAASDAADDSGEHEEAGTAPQMAGEPAMPAEAAEKAEEVRPTARTAGLENGGALRTAPASAPAAPEAAMEDSSPEMFASDKAAVLYLTAEEAGDLLDGFVPVWENNGERRYELGAEDYRALLEALDRQEELPEAAEGPFLVAVTEF